MRTKELKIYKARVGKLGVETTRNTGPEGLTYTIGINPNGFQTICTPACNLQMLLMLEVAVKAAIADHLIQKPVDEKAGS